MARPALLQRRVSLLSLSLLCLVPLVQSNGNGLAQTPPMGWMAWERFRCDTDCKDDLENCISEKLFMDMADRLSEDGWRELGYEYVIIDDCWMSRIRDKNGTLQPDPDRFPSGIKRLADYVHNRGLKLGIYADMGRWTCMGFPGTTLDKIELDAQTFASWGVDYLKFDGCNSNALEQLLGYPLMSKALNATGRPMVYSCSWPVYIGSLPPEVNYTLLGDICHLWRNYYDIQDSWDSVQFIMDWFFNNQDYIQPAAGPGKWNDPDMLIIGNFGLSLEQSRTQMALWSIMASPLIMSNDLRSLDNAARAILQNKAAISINQDPLGIQGRRLFKEKTKIEVYWRPLVDAASALVFLSRRSDMPYHYHTSLEKLGFGKGNYEVYDVFEGSKPKPLNSTEQFTVSINPSGVVMWYLKPVKTDGFFFLLIHLL
uniref:Alpha-galactosidase n=1 Tax=Neogobius melanostomus TaxID=47308 RepID=A0A8C6STJ4_9GOBI